MGRPLFGLAAAFYAVTAGSGGGGGSSLTPPAAIIGAIPQLNFSDVANTGGYLQNSAAAGTILTDGAYFDGAAWIPKDTGAVMLQMNGALAGFVMYVNTSLTPGTPFTPTMVYQYLGAGSNVDFAPPVGATGGVVVSGGSLPTTGDSLSITKTNIAAKNWGAGTYNALAIQASGFTFQTGTSSITSSLAFDQFGVLTQSHVAQAGAQETLYGVSVADDATGKFRVRNSTPTDNFFLPMLEGTSGSTNAALQLRAIVTTDTGTTAGMYFDSRVTGDVTITTRPLFIWANNSAIQSTMLADGSQWWGAAPAQFGVGSYTMAGRRTSTITTSTTTASVFEVYANPAASSTAVYSGSYHFGTVNTANAQNFTASTAAIIGSRHLVAHKGSGTVTGMAGVFIDTALNSGGGTVTNAYGVYVAAPTVGTNNYTLYGAGGLIENVGSIRSTGLSAPTTGTGIEMGWNGTRSILLSIDRTGPTYKPIALDGSQIEIRPNGTAVLTVTASSATYGVGINYRVTTITAAGPTTLAGDDHVGWNPTVSAAGQINLVATPATGQEVTINDIKGIAAANNLTISGNGKNINGGTTATTEVIATNFGGRVLWYDGTQWNIKAKV